MVDKAKLRDFIQETAAISILVVGDVMLDQYYFGEVSRISPEAPVPVNRVTSTKRTLGGAGNVAHNLALMGATTTISGVIGGDHHGEILSDKLRKRLITSELITTTKPTTAKLRIIGGHQQMLRLDFEDTAPLTETELAELLAAITPILPTTHAVIISDYGKGVCTKDLCQAVIKAAHAEGVPVFVDPKGGDWTKYEHADYITPNLKEINQVLAAAAENSDVAVTAAAEFVREKFQIGEVLVTRSEHGLSLIGKQPPVHIPTKAQEVFDVSGAGDTVLAVFALAIAGGLAGEAAAYLANLAAGVVVGKVGTYAISQAELLERLGG